MGKVIQVSVDQTDETKLEQQSDGNGLTVRYASFRSADTRKNNKKGQDYLAFNLEPGRVFFALCDGVSQSFFGEVGAKILGRGLIDWLTSELDLANLPVFPENSESNLSIANRLIPKLTKKLNDLCEPGTMEIYKRDISQYNEILREVLEERREQHGTQANFTCGVIESPRETLEFGRMLLFWLGDAKCHWFVGMQDHTHSLGAQWTTDERWSSKDGVIGGTVHSYMDITHKISTLVAHSDGLDPFPIHWYQPFLPREILNAHLATLWDVPSSDDVSLIEINIHNKVFPYKSSVPVKPGETAMVYATTPVPAISEVSGIKQKKPTDAIKQGSATERKSNDEMAKSATGNSSELNWDDKQFREDRQGILEPEESKVRGSFKPNNNKDPVEKPDVDDEDSQGIRSWLRKLKFDQIFLWLIIVVILTLVLWLAMQPLIKWAPGW